MNDTASAGDQATLLGRQALGMDLLRSVMKRRYLVPIALFLFVSGMLIGLKLIRLDQQHGDSAMYFQITDNIAARGVPATNISAAVTDFLAQQINNMTAQQVADDPLVPKGPEEVNYFGLHANYILYPIAVFAKVFPANAVLLTLYVLSFTGLVLLAYFALRDRGIPVVAAALFCIYIIFHPAWSTGLDWQFYPERIFVLSGFVLMLLASRNGGRAALIVTAAICASISERAAIMAGIFLVLYPLLYWRTDRDRTFKLALGAASFAYGVVVLKFVLVNPEYSGYFPKNFAGLIANFQSPHFMQGLGLFALVNAGLLVVALFEWRAALIAFVIMLPNVVGTLGGVEKVGFYSHYHDLYLPALVWAALAGFASAYRMATARKGLVPVFYGAAFALALALGSLDTSTMAQASVTPANLRNSFFVKFVNESEEYYGPEGAMLARAYGDLSRAVPVNAVVTMPEGGMSVLYHDRIIQFFPLDIDRAGYAIMSVGKAADGSRIYIGTPGYFLGAAEAHRVDQILLARMKKDGYDLSHPVVIPRLGMAVFKRVGAKSK